MGSVKRVLATLGMLTLLGTGFTLVSAPAADAACDWLAATVNGASSATVRRPNTATIAGTVVNCADETKTFTLRIKVTKPKNAPSFCATSIDPATFTLAARETLSTSEEVETDGVPNSCTGTWKIKLILKSSGDKLDVAKLALTIT